MDNTLITSAMDELSARQSASSSPTPTTSAGQTACGTTPPTGPSRERKEQVSQLVSQVFTRLEAIFPRTWSSAFPSTDMLTLARREVAQELARWPALPTRAVVERAMSELKRGGSTWPPTIPALISLLAPKPEDFGMPAVAEAWAEVTRHAHEPRGHRWRHEAVRLAGNQVGWWEITHVQASRVDRLERRFAKHYAALVNRVMAGEDLTPRHLLEHDASRTPAEKADIVGREAIQKQLDAAGLPHSMTPEQGFAAIRKALGRD